MTAVHRNNRSVNRGERFLLIAGALAIAAYGTFLFRNLSFAAGGPDTGGYMNEARLIASGRVTTPVGLVRTFGLDDSWLGYFMPLGFGPSKGAAMHPTYPPGLPIHLAVAALIGGWKHAPFYVAPLAAVGCLIMIVAVGRKLGIPLVLSLGGAAIVAAGPAFLWHAVQPASDVLATFWALVTVWLALDSRERPSMALAAGVAYSIGVWVRPTSALLVFPLALAVRLRWKHLLFLGAGAFPFGVALMVWSSRLYGSAFRTGYGDISMSWAGVMNAAPQYAEWLVKMMTVLIFPAGLVVIVDRLVDGWTRAMLAVWFVVFYVFYSFYGFFDGWQCIRFLLPAIPALVFGALLVIRDLVRLANRFEPVATAVAIGLVLWTSLAPVRSTQELGILPILKTVESGYPRYIEWAERRVPKRAVVVTGVLSGPFFYYANRSIVRYDQLNDERFQILRAYAGIHGMPWYAVVTSEEIDLHGLRQRFRGDWKMVERLYDVTIYRLE